MKITQIRNATVLLEFNSNGKNIGLIVDPMLSPKGTLMPFKYLGKKPQRNPIVDLPETTPEILNRVTHCLITHCQKAHADHLDRAGKSFLRKRKVPVWCMERDVKFLASSKIMTQSLGNGETRPFFHGKITPIPCVHGRGFIGLFMDHGFGYYIEIPGEPTVYISGDTLLTDDVTDCLLKFKPDVAILPGGGARLDIGSEIIMNSGDIIRASGFTDGKIIVNHLEALDHCTTRREDMKELAIREGLTDKILIPEDGSLLDFNI